MFDLLFILVFLGIVITWENYIIGPAGCKAGRTGGTVPPVRLDSVSAYRYNHDERGY